MKALKIIGAMVLLLAIVYFILPSTAHVERSIVIDAQPDAVFAHMNGMKKFHEWSPWASLDPDMKVTFEGAEEGVGSKMSWESEVQEVGSGSQWIVESIPNKFVKNHLTFGPDADPTEAAFTLIPQDGGTKVTWTFDAKDMSGGDKIFATFADKMLGPQYEQGLSNLKKLVE